MSQHEAMGVMAKVVAEAGRWVVYLGVDFWLAYPPGPGYDRDCDRHTHDYDRDHACDDAPAHASGAVPDHAAGYARDDNPDRSGDHPVETVWHRIADFPSEAAARIAARLYERVADRCPPGRLPQEYRRDAD
jgi:hypothetical protein